MNKVRNILLATILSFSYLANATSCVPGLDGPIGPTGPIGPIGPGSLTIENGSVENLPPVKCKLKCTLDCEPDDNGDTKCKTNCTVECETKALHLLTPQ